MNKISTPDSGHVVMVFNSIPPYAYEVNNILALPNGFSYRFRFQRKWMPSIEDPMDLRAREGLIVLRNFETAKFTPLRRVKIVNVREVGDIYYIGYILGDIIDFDSLETIHNEQLRRFNERMVAAIGDFENLPKQDLKNLIFKSSDLAYGIKDQSFKGEEKNRAFNSWGTLVQILCKTECYIDFDFLKVLEIADSKGQAAPIETYPSPDTARFHLKNGTGYRAYVFQRAFTHLQGQGDSSVQTARQIILSSESKEVIIIQPMHSVVGKYDLYPFPFKATVVGQMLHTSLSLSVKRDDERVIPNIDIPIEVTISKKQVLVWILSLSCFLFSLFVLFGADKVSAFLSVSQDLVERVSIVIAIVSSYGLGPLAKSVLDRVGYKM